MATINAGQYTYDDCISCTGGTFTGSMPHPIDANVDDSIIQITAVAIGGPNGLNS